MFKQNFFLALLFLVVPVVLSAMQSADTTDAIIHYKFKLVNDENKIVTLPKTALSSFVTLHHMVDDLNVQDNASEEPLPIQHVTTHFFNVMKHCVTQLDKDDIKSYLKERAENSVGESKNRERRLDKYLVQGCNRANFLDCRPVFSALLDLLKERLIESTENLEQLEKRVEQLQLNSDLALMLGNHIVESSGCDKNIVFYSRFEIGQTIPTHNKISKIDLSGNGITLAWAHGSLCTFWDLKTNSKIITFKDNAPIEFLSLNYEGDIVALGNNHNIILFNIKDKIIIKTLPSHELTAICLSHSFLIMGFLDGHIEIYNLETDITTSMPEMGSHSAKIFFITIALDGKTFFTGSNDGSLRIWNLEDYSLKDVFYTNGFWLERVAVSALGNEVFLSGFREYGKNETEYKTFVWSTTPKRLMLSFTRGANSTFIPCWPNAKKILYLDELYILTNKIAVYNRNNFEYCLDFKGLNAQLFCVDKMGLTIAAVSKKDIKILKPAGKCALSSIFYNKGVMAALVAYRILKQKNADQPCKLDYYKPYLPEDLQTLLVEWGILKK